MEITQGFYHNDKNVRRCTLFNALFMNLSVHVSFKQRETVVYT